MEKLILAFTLVCLELMKAYADIEESINNATVLIAKLISEAVFLNFLVWRTIAYCYL
jgi:hypothetical protein